MSLLRESNRFAYQNTTPLEVYIKNNTISTPIDPNFALFTVEIGPFGSVDLIHVPPPSSLLKLTQQILEILSVVLATNGTQSQNAFRSLPVVSSMMPVPMTLRPHLVSGGSFLCSKMPAPLHAAHGMLLFFASEASCSLEISEMLLLEPHQAFFASFASEMTTEQIPIACSGDTASLLDCINLFQSILNFTTTFVPQTALPELHQEVVRDVASIQMMQYIINQTTNSREIFHQPLLHESDPAVTLFGWIYLYDWAMGIREVVQINGDNSELKVISTFSIPTTFTVDAMEVPKSFSGYCRALCQYVSFVLAMIAIIACMYSMFNQFTTEGYNLFETNRVGGLVWIGRPLLLVRSLTALAILSTATLELQLIGNTTVLASTHSGKSTFAILLTKLLAAGEVTWLIYIIQDLAMVFTRETTTSYGPISSVLTWLVSFCLSVASPVTHKASINRQCSIDIMDYQVVCSTGTLVIGSIDRFLTLVALSVGISFVCYLYHHYRYIPKRVEHPSCLLSSEWVYNELYYIDYASAALTGIITIPRRQKLYIFDIKIWRFFVIDCNEHPSHSSEKSIAINSIASGRPVDPNKTTRKHYSYALDIVPRKILLNDLTSISDAIKEIWLMDPAYAISIFTQYCWVDFDHRWEMDHAYQRQLRCYKRYLPNGVVYVESFLRNIEWDSWYYSNHPNFIKAIVQTSDGQVWLSSLPNAFKSIDSEMNYWMAKGVLNYVLQWNNRVQTGLSESIDLINVFGAKQPLTTYHISYSSRVATWTTFGLYWAYPDDLWAASVMNGSLVRNATNDVALQRLSTSSDIIYVVTTFDSLLLRAVRANITLYSQYQLLTTLTLDPVLKSWTELNYNYYGGSTLCNARAATTFVQASYSFDDVCGQPKPLQITTNPQSALFAYSRLRVVGASPIDSYGLCSTTRAECTVMMHQLDKIYNGLISNTTLPGLITTHQM
ncbi:hypothetical protein THRCLA_11115 [Thraustotheca clavata]|uniref:Transmembrane protein n=1 Tax=Thraustotheca clavata TaxID=74557 RepID=A0A1V9Y8R9_9STRA|nr:hypothetical protein THRCLA_11115 [Thraustotheca clavata]